MLPAPQNIPKLFTCWNLIKLQNFAHSRAAAPQHFRFVVGIYLGAIVGSLVALFAKWRLNSKCVVVFRRWQAVPAAVFLSLSLFEVLFNEFTMLKGSKAEIFKFIIWCGVVMVQYFIYTRMSWSFESVCENMSGLFVSWLTIWSSEHLTVTDRCMFFSSAFSYFWFTFKLSVAKYATYLSLSTFLVTIQQQQNRKKITICSIFNFHTNEVALSVSEISSACRTCCFLSSSLALFCFRLQLHTCSHIYTYMKTILCNKWCPTCLLVSLPAFTFPFWPQKICEYAYIQRF